MQNTTGDNLNLLELLQPLFKWWWLLVISAMLAIFSSVYYTSQQPLVYTSTTTIMVGNALSDPNPNGTEFGLASQLAAAYADIANRSTIQSATKEALGLTWLPEYVARYVPNTQLLEITVVDTIPERAQIVSQTLSEQLVLLSPGGQAQQGRQEFIEMQLAKIEAAIVETDAEIERLESEMAQMFSARQIADTRTQLAALESKRASLQNNYSTMFSNSSRNATNTVVIVEDATFPRVPLNNDLIRNIAIAALLGAAMASAGAYLLEFSNDSIKSEQEIQGSLGLLSLGLLPQIQNNNKQTAVLLSGSAGRSELSDAYAALRLNVQTMLMRHNINAIAISSPTSEDRRQIVAANLCVELARSGLKVILVDADLHRPSQQRIFNQPNHYGFSSLLSDDNLSIVEVLRATEVPTLSLITSGPLPANSAALLGQRRLHKVLDQLRKQADLIVFDIPPINAIVDALLLASELDGVILTLVAQRTRKQDVERSIDALRRIDAEIIGTVMCNASSSGTVQRYGYKIRPHASDIILGGRSDETYKSENSKEYPPVKSQLNSKQSSVLAPDTSVIQAPTPSTNGNHPPKSARRKPLST